MDRRHIEPSRNNFHRSQRRTRFGIASEMAAVGGGRVAKPVCREGCVGGLVWRGGASGGTMLAVRASRISASVNSMYLSISPSHLLSMPCRLWPQYCVTGETVGIDPHTVSALAKILCYRTDRWDRPSHQSNHTTLCYSPNGTIYKHLTPQ